MPQTRTYGRTSATNTNVRQDQCHKHERPSVLSEQPNENIGGTTKYIPDLCTAMRQIVSREIVRNVMNLIMLMKLDFLKGHPVFRSSRSA